MPITRRSPVDIFDPSFPFSLPFSPDDNTDDYDVNARMSQLYHPQNQASEHLTALLNQFPQRSAPGTLQKIGAAMANVGGNLNLGQDILYGPYNRQLADWKLQVDPAVQAANAERAGNTNERGVANSIISNEMSDRRLNRQITKDRTIERQGDERLKQGDTRLKQADERIKVAKAVARGGQFQMDKSSGQGKMVFKDGSSIPVDIHQLPQEDLLELNQNYALERIDDMAQNRPGSRDRVRIDTIEDPNNPGKRILVSINLDTNEVKPVQFGTGSTKTNVTPTTRESAKEEALTLDARALELKNSNKAWAPYIKMDKQGRFREITTPGLLFGPDQAMYDQISRALYGDKAPLKANVPADNNVNQSNKRADGKTHVKRKSDGQTGWVSNPDPKLYEVIP